MGPNKSFFRFVVQRKDQTTTGIAELLLEMPTTPSETMSIMYSWAAKYLKKKTPYF